jgi:hypothetical protein
MSVSDINREKEHSMFRVYHSGVALTGGRPTTLRPIAPLRGDPVDAALHVTITHLAASEGC